MWVNLEQALKPDDSGIRFNLQVKYLSRKVAFIV